MKRTETDLAPVVPSRSAERRRPPRAWLLALLALAVLAAACGGDDDSAADESGEDGEDSAEEAAEPEIDPNGVLTIGSGLEFPAGLHFDPIRSAVNADNQWMELVFGNLFRDTADGSIEPWMASDYEVVDDQTLSITLNEGIEFPNGDVYDAETVKFGLERTLNEASDVTAPSLNAAFTAISEITVDGPRELTIRLDTPQVGELIVALADREGVIVSPTQAADAPEQIDTDPIGAGPYTADEIVSGQTVSLSKRDDAWSADEWPLAGIEWVHTADGAVKVNGLLSGKLNMSALIPDPDLAALEGNSGFELHRTFVDRNYVVLNPCTGKPPLDDVDVRNALQMGIDRQEISDLLYEGNAQPAAGLWPEGHAYYNPEVEQYNTYDPEQAEELLGGETVQLDIYPATPDYARIGEVLQSQLSEVGFDVNLVAVRDIVAEFITPQNPGLMIIPGSRSGADKYNRVFSEGQIQALCGQSRPEIVETLAPVGALAPGSDEAAEYFKEADLTVAENGYLVPIVFTPLNTATAEEVGGEMQFSGVNGNPLLDTFHIEA